jgi:hypothetical protein
LLGRLDTARLCFGRTMCSRPRHIYESAGFELVRTERHNKWSRAVIGEHWELTL